MKQMLKRNVKTVIENVKNFLSMEDLDILPAKGEYRILKKGSLSLLLD
jgi:hypothetical protein